MRGGEPTHLGKYKDYNNNLVVCLKMLSTAVLLEMKWFSLNGSYILSGAMLNGEQLYCALNGTDGRFA